MSVTSVSRLESPTNLPASVSSEMDLLARVQAVVLSVLSQNPEKSSSTLQDFAIKQLQRDCIQVDQATTQTIQSILETLNVENLYKNVTNTDSLLESDEVWDLLAPVLSQVPHDQLMVAVEDFYLNILTPEIQKEFPLTSSEECKKILRAGDFSISNLCYSEFIDAIRSCFEEQERILNYYFGLERSGKVFEKSPQNLDLAYYSSAQSLELWESFHEKYQTFFDWVKDNCSLSAEGDNIPQSSFTPFFLSHLHFIHANALICIANKVEDLGFTQGNGLSLLYQEFQSQVFQKEVPIDKRVKIFLENLIIYAKASLYEAYKAKYPDTFSEDLFSILYERKQQKSNVFDSDDAFLEKEQRQERNILIDLLWKSEESKDLFLPRFFHSPESIQKMKNQLFEEIGRAEQRLNPDLTIQDAWDMLDPSPVLLTYETFKSIALEVLGYKMNIRLFISKHQAKVEIGYADEEIKRFEEDLDPKSPIKNSYNQFLANLEKKLDIRATIQIIENAQPKLDRSLTSLQKHLETLRKQSCSKEEETVLLHAMNRIILLDLVGFSRISPPRESDLSKRKKDLTKILTRAQFLLENLGSHPSFKVELKDLTEEYIQALYLAFIYVTTKKQMTTEYANMDLEEKKRIQGQPMTSSFFVKSPFISSIANNLSTFLQAIFGDSLPRKSYYLLNLEIEIHSFIKTLSHNFSEN